MPVCRNERAALAVTFTRAAGVYWLTVYPRVRRELRHWRGRAQAIPDPQLRRLALATQREERGNLEGAAAYAVLAPRSQRARVVRAVVAFQAIYDYADTLAEEPSADPVGNGRELHRALASALDPNDTEHPDYYAHSLHKDDGGYLRELVDACRRAFGALPSHASLAAPAQAAVERIVAFQGIAHGAHGAHGADGAHGTNGAPGAHGTNDAHGAPDAHGAHGTNGVHDAHGTNGGDSGHEDAWRAFSSWAEAQIPPDTGLQWWETAAGAASSLLLFALIAAAAEPSVREQDTAAIELAYFPWIGALHLLLDSLVDRAGDVSAGRQSLVEHYGSPRELAGRLGTISTEAVRAAQALPSSERHELILAAMVSFYLTQPAASSPAGALAGAEILAALGERAVPTMWLLRARRWRRAR